MFDFSRPLLTIRDPELIRQITVKDFEYFTDHWPLLADPMQEPFFGKSLFMLSGKRWRHMRATLSPAFTGSKMRQMFQMVIDCAENNAAVLLTEAKATRKPFVPDIKDVFSRFTNDAIVSAAFGIRVNSHKDRDNEFFEKGKRSTNLSSPWVMFKFLILNTLPKVFRKSGIRLLDADCAEFYSSLVHDAIQHREKKGIIRPDMIQLLMDARAAQRKGGRDNKSEAFDNLWDNDEVTAQCFLFFFAAFETSATALCFTAHELMENPDVQQRLIAEIDAARAELNGKQLTYDDLQNMKYLDMVVSGKHSERGVDQSNACVNREFYKQNRCANGRPQWSSIGSASGRTK